MKASRFRHMELSVEHKTPSHTSSDALPVHHRRVAVVTFPLSSLYAPRSGFETDEKTALDPEFGIQDD